MTRDIQSLGELLDQSVARFSARPLFLRRSGEVWEATSYAEFAQMVSDFGAGLAQLGVTRGDRVGVIASNSLEWAVIAYASYALVATLVPMYESQRETELEFIVRDSGVKVLFASTPEIAAKVAGLERKAPRLERVLCIAESYEGLLQQGRSLPRVDCLPPSRQDTAALIYTSGTTGDPKGVVLSHGNVLSNVLAVRNIIAATVARPEEHRTLSFLPWAHAFGHTVELHSLIACGASMAIAESLEKIVSNIREVKPTVLVAVPTVFLRIHAGVRHLMTKRSRWIRWLFRRGLEVARQRSNQQGLSKWEWLLLLAADVLILARIRARFGGRLRFAICGAAALPTEAAELMDAIGITVYEGYGLTEASPIVAANAPGARKLGSVGRPLPGVRIEIHKPEGAEDEAGEIVVYGENIMQGYHGRDEETSRVIMHGGGLRTGDLGRLDDDGFLFVTGRIKEQYKLTNARYVAPSRLEDRLKLSSWIDNVMVYGDNRAYNVALIVPNAEAVLSFASTAGLGHRQLAELLALPEVKAQVAREITRFSTDFKGYERIREFALLAEPFSQDSGTLTPSLKLKRREVVKRFGDVLERLYPARAGVQTVEGDRLGFIS